MSNEKIEIEQAIVYLSGIVSMNKATISITSDKTLDLLTASIEKLLQYYYENEKQ